MLNVTDLTSNGYRYTEGSFSIVRSGTVYERAEALARGSYQRAILAGTEAISGSTLAGKAARYSSRYKASAKSFLDRCRKAGLEVEIVVGRNGRRVVAFA